MSADRRCAMSHDASSSGAASRRSRSASPRRRSSPTSRARRARSRRNLVVLYLSGGNDALSTVIPYTDAQYYARRPALGDPGGERAADRTDRAGNALGLNPRLTGLQDDLRRRPSGDHPAHRLPELEPLAFPGHRHLVHGRSRHLRRAPGWLGRYLDHAAVAGGSARRRGRPSREMPRRCCARTGRRAGDPERRRLRVREPEQRRDRTQSSRATARRASRRTCRSTCRTSRS